MSQSTLKRSQKTDFTMSAVSRERSFVRPNRDPLKRRSQTMALMRGKPTLELYRPPNVRSDGAPLNVHAKEFTMSELQASRSSIHLPSHEHHPLQHSKSSGHVMRHHPHIIPLIPTALPLPLLNHLPRVTYHQEVLAHPVFPGVPFTWSSTQAQALKRSKSLGASDSQNLATKLKNLAKEDIDLGSFPEAEQEQLKLAMEDPNQLTSRTVMDLVKMIMERVVEGIRFCESGAKVCIAIIEKEKNQTFLESLLNMCQQWYQERDKILRGVKAGDGTRFTAFMWFLTEMCSQLKRHGVKEEQEALQADLVLLSVLAKCCQACVSLPIKCLSETECLFFVLTSIGRDLEAELPQQLEQLLANVRDGFLASAGSPSVRRTLLQLIELHASNWQLPGSSVLYYYPRIK